MARNPVPPRPDCTPAFGLLLRHWRAARSLSQLDLSVEAGISARHLSFLETGRAKPSREMAALLGSVLDMPLSERNAMLLAAGYAPAYAERALDSSDLEPARRALTFILQRQEPYPAYVVDSGWNVRMANAAANRVFAPFLEGAAMSQAHAGNLLHSVCHPGGVRRYIVNWDEFVSPLVAALHRQAADGTDTAAVRLRDEILAYPGIPADWRKPRPAAGPLIAMRLCKDELRLAFFSTITSFAVPHDVTLQKLHIESLYPADTMTEKAARRLAAGPAGTDRAEESAAGAIGERA